MARAGVDDAGRPALHRHRGVVRRLARHPSGAGDDGDRHIRPRDTVGPREQRSLAGTAIGESHSQFYPVLGHGAYHRDGGVFSIRGSGDIGPAITASGDTAATILTQALIVTLIVIVLLAATFITSEYRRGLIRTTLSATPSRGRVLAAKAAVIAGATFVVGTIATAIAVPLGEHLLSRNGNFMYPTDLATQLRVILGSGAMLALCGVAVLAIGGLLRRTSGTVLMCIVVFVLPPIIAAPFISTGTNGSGPAWVEWLLRLTPAAACRS